MTTQMAAEIADSTYPTWYASEDYDHEKLRYFARGTYQQELLQGRQRWSGGDLRGKAQRFSGRYRASRDSLIARLKRAGVPMRWATGKHGLRILVIG